MVSRPVAIALGVLLGATAAARAQPPAKHLTAARSDGPITVDGALDDPAWAAAAPIRDLVQKLPAYGAAPRHPTEIRVLYDRDALYVGARMWDAPGATRAAVTRRDVTRDAERFIVSLDPFRSGRQAYSFAVTVAGVRADWIHTDDDEGARDLSWDPVWSAATRRLPDGWSAELRLPWTQLRYPAGDDRPWGVNFNRYVPDRNEDLFWLAVPRERTAWSSYMGELRGLRELPRRLGIELRPYAAAALAVAERDGDVDPDGDLGLDAKIGLGAGLTLDLAVNPDFGQVEADPAVVNLTAFEVSLPERRPFFVAGNEIFATAPTTYFYSRRIGAEPDRVLGAAKLSGRVGGRTHVGALAALTDSSAASEGLAGWGVARVTHELGRSYVGATLAGVGRALDGPAADLRPRASLVGGVDGVARWDDGGWELSGYAGGSGLWGEATAIAAVQRSSTHYFQRPDADHKQLDPTRTALAGWHGGARLERRAGSMRGDLGLDLESPGYDANGTGLLREADEVAVPIGLGWHDTTPSRRWQGWSVALEALPVWTFGGERRAASVELGGAATTPGFVDLELSLGATLPGLSDSLTRGGPLVATGGGGWVGASASSRGSSTVTWSISASAEHVPSGNTGAAGGASISMRPADRLRLELAPRAEVQHQRLQYVATPTAPGPAATFGTRHVFATLDQRELAMVLRAELTLGPDLAIDLYVEPFVSTGAFRDFAELRAAGTGDLRRYTSVTRTGTTVRIDDGATFELPEPDFTSRSLRSTAVLRWEPRPGSTLYAVWQQDRAGDEARRRALGPGVIGALGDRGAHTLAVKLSWWFAR